MWIKRSTAFFLLVKVVRSGGKSRLFRAIVIPVPLFLLDDLLDSSYSLVRWGEALGKTNKKVSPAIKILRTMIDELRHTGRMTLVDVDAGEIRVNIDLY